MTAPIMTNRATIIKRIKENKTGGSTLLHPKRNIARALAQWRVGQPEDWPTLQRRDFWARTHCNAGFAGVLQPSIDQHTGIGHADPTNGLPHLADTTQSGLASRRVLPGHKAKPGSKIPAALKCAKILSKCEDRADGHGSDAGSSAKSTHIFIRFDRFSKFQHQPVDFLGQQPDLIQVKLAHLSNSSRKIICLIGQNSHYRSEIGGSLNNDDPEFAKMSTQRIDELGTMAHEALVRSKRHRSGLMFSP